MAPDLDPSPEALTQAFGQAVRFQRYLLRRACGIVYAIWAGAIAALLGLPIVIGRWPGASSLAEGIGVVVVTLAAFLAAAFSSRRVSQQALRTTRLRTLSSAPLPGTGLWVWLLVPAFILTIFAEVIVGHSALVFFYLFVTGLAAFSLQRQRQALGQVPPDGAWAYGSLIVGAVITIGLLVSPEWPIYPWVWVPVLGVWLAAALYALYRAPEELIGEGT